MGVNTSVIKPNGTVGTASGTSLAAPLVTSLVALVWQQYPQLTNKELIEAIRKSGSQASAPDNFLGYGIPNYNSIVGIIEEELRTSTFKVYPNPLTSDTIIIEPSFSTANSHYKVEFLSAQGQIIFTRYIDFSPSSPAYKATVNTLAPGIYFMHLFLGDKKFTYKIIKL